VNLFVQEAMIDRNFAAGVDSSLVVRRSAHDTGYPDGSVDAVYARYFPIQFDEFIIDVTGGRASIELLAAEICRVLRPGGEVAFHCSSCDQDSLSRTFAASGLVGVRVVNGIVIGMKP